MRKILAWIIVGFAFTALLAFVAVQIWFARSVLPVEPFKPTANERAQLAFYQQPEQWFIEHVENPREVVDSQTLDPKLQYLAEQARPSAPWIWRLAPAIFATPWGREHIRNRVDRDWRMFTKTSAPMASVEDRRIPGRDGHLIPIRIFRPKAKSAGPLPILVYHHGGGWIFASIAASDRVTRLIANEAKAIVVSVDYRLAPEHPYPAASNDGEDAFRWARAHAGTLGGDPAMVGVGGDSAGGHVAINIAQRQQRRGGIMPAAMLLYYPGAGLPQHDRSYKLFGHGYLLDAAFIEFILPRVFKGYSPDMVADGYQDPAGKGDLRGLPPTIVATAGFDILRDSGARFAKRLGEARVPVTYVNYGSLTHSFLQFSGISTQAERATVEPARDFGEMIRKSVVADQTVGRR